MTGQAAWIALRKLAQGLPAALARTSSVGGGGCLGACLVAGLHGTVQLQKHHELCSPSCGDKEVP